MAKYCQFIDGLCPALYSTATCCAVDAKEPEAVKRHKEYWKDRGFCWGRPESQSDAKVAPATGG